MPPPRIAALAREPYLTAAAPAGVKKDTGGYGAGYSGFGWGAWGFLPGSTGQAITPYAALQISTAWACVNRISQDMGKLPRRIYNHLPNGGRRIVRDHPLCRVLRSPNQWQTASQFWGYLTAWLMLRGNCFAVVVRGDAGEPVSLIPISPDRCNVLVSQETGQIYYQISHPFFGGSRRFHRDNVLHVRTLISFDGYSGVSPIAAAQDVFGLGIATQQHGAVLFRQGTQLNGIVKHPGVLSPEAKTNLKQQFAERHAGVQRAHGNLLLDEGMTFEKVAMTNEDSQFLQSRQFTVPEVCRMFNVPPHKVHDLSNAHFNNIEQSELAYRSDSLLPIGIQYGEECQRVLLFEDEQDHLEVGIDYDELLRTDKLTRYQTYQIGLNNGIVNRNEARIDDGREPVDGGDEFRVPLNTGAPGAVPDPPLGAANKPPPATGSS